MGSKLFFTPLTNKCDKYLLLSKKRFNVCWGESLKFLDIEITKNYKTLEASLTVFLEI